MPDGSARLRGRPIGAHAPTSGGLASGSLRYAAAVGAEAIQVFVANPRSWALTRRDAAQQAAQEEALREAAAEARMPVFVHAPYLVNVASPDPRLRALSAGSIRHSLARGAAIGARGVVVHTGSATDGNSDGGLARARECLLPILAGIGADAPDLLLEPMAGQGNALCSLVADLGPYLDALSWHPRAGICLDTCHLFAAGHDLAGPAGPAIVLAELDALAAGRLRLVHANDSRDCCGSTRDRHAAIGQGQIGTAAFASLLSHPATDGAAFVVETPGGAAGQAADIAALRELRETANLAGPRPRRGRGRPAGQGGGRPAGQGGGRPAGQGGGPSPGCS